jgi:hypothetical protein
VVLLVQEVAAVHQEVHLAEALLQVAAISRLYYHIYFLIVRFKPYNCCLF